MPASTLGGTVAWLTRRSATNSASPAPGRCSVDRGITTVPPATSVVTTSATAESQPRAAKNSTRLPGHSVNRSACAAASPASPRWDTTTPLGVPVDPEV